jgi:hypothetical protein
MLPRKAQANPQQGPGQPFRVSSEPRAPRQHRPQRFLNPHQRKSRSCLQTKEILVSRRRQLRRFLNPHQRKSRSCLQTKEMLPISRRQLSHRPLTSKPPGRPKVLPPPRGA